MSSGDRKRRAPAPPAVPSKGGKTAGKAAPTPVKSKGAPKKGAGKAKKPKLPPVGERHPLFPEIRIVPAGPPREARPEDLRWRIDGASLGFKTTKDVPACAEIIGQERALRAMRLGLKLRSRGYNIYVSGLTGTGKTTTVQHLMESLDLPARVPDDVLYVHNFKDPDTPLVLRLPAGRGVELRKDMSDLVDYLQAAIPEALESKGFKEERQRTFERVTKERRKAIEEFEERVKKAGFVLLQVGQGSLARPVLAPVVDDDPVPMDALDALVKDGKLTREKADAFRAAQGGLQEEFERVVHAARENQRRLEEAMEKLTHRFVSPMVETELHQLAKKYEGSDRVAGYLRAVERDILGHLERFQTDGSEEDGDPAAALVQTARPAADPFLEYRVNVLVDNSGKKRAPVVVETSPTYRNLFGTIEKVVDRSGHWRTDFTRIKPGAIVKADGGYLVFNLLDAATEPGVWPTLKRVLKNQKLDLTSFDPYFSYFGSAITPEPMPLDVKVVVIGDPYTYHLLFDLDEDFQKIFRVRADFDTVMVNDAENVHKYATFVRRITEEEDLPHFDASGVAAVVEQGVRSAGRVNKLSTRFSDVADLVREAAFWAGEAGDGTVRDAHVRKAIDEKVLRSNLYEEKLQEMIEEGMILLDVDGGVVGQVNGLSVYDLGDYAFGKPSRITVQTSMGRSGIINVEREAELSGKTHNKGVLIIEGFLRGRFAQNKPLSVSASICFEQSYSGVDGDSASSTEIYGILSTLAQLPIRQDIAVTGTVNQRGEIQPIGGVNQKIEGFFDVCRARGLTGKQGVVMPDRNLPDLMLRPDVVEACREGKFHVWPVATIDQGIEVLTGVKAGGIGADNRWEEGTVNDLVDRSLEDFAIAMRDFYEEGEPEEGEGGDDRKAPADALEEDDIEEDEEEGEE